MQSFNLSSLYVLSVMMIICAIAFILPEENLHLLFGVLLCIALLHIWCQKYFIYMLSPMVILFVYVTVNLFIGGWAHFNGYVMSEKQLIAFSEWRNYRVSVIYYILSLAIIYFIDSCYRNKYADIGGMHRRLSNFERAKIQEKSDKKINFLIYSGVIAVVAIFVLFISL